MTEYDDNPNSASSADQEPPRGSGTGSPRPSQEFRTLGMRLLGSARQHIRRYSATANQPVPDLPHSWNTSEPLNWAPQPPAGQVSRAPAEQPPAAQAEPTAEESFTETEPQAPGGVDPILVRLLRGHQERIAREEAGKTAAQAANSTPQSSLEQDNSATNPFAGTDAPAYNPPAIMRTTTRRRGAVIDVTPPVKHSVEPVEVDVNLAAANSADDSAEPSALSSDNRPTSAETEPPIQRQVDAPSPSQEVARETPPQMTVTPTASSLSDEVSSIQREAAPYSPSRVEIAAQAPNSARPLPTSPQVDVPLTPSTDSGQKQIIGEASTSSASPMIVRSVANESLFEPSSAPNPSDEPLRPATSSTPSEQIQPNTTDTTDIARMSDEETDPHPFEDRAVFTPNTPAEPRTDSAAQSTRVSFVQRSATPQVSLSSPAAPTQASSSAPETSIQRKAASDTSAPRQDISSNTADVSTPVRSESDPIVDQSGSEITRAVTPDISRTTQPSSSQPAPLNTQAAPAVPDTSSLQRAAAPRIDQAAPQTSRAILPDASEPIPTATNQPAPLNTSAASPTPETPGLLRTAAPPIEPPAREISHTAAPDISQTIHPSTSQPASLNTSWPSSTSDVPNIQRATRNRVDQPTPLNIQGTPTAPDPTSLQHVAAPHIDQPASEITAPDTTVSIPAPQPSASQPTTLNTSAVSSAPDVLNVQRAAQNHVNQPTPEMNRPATSDASESIPTARPPTNKPALLNTPVAPSTPDAPSLQRAAAALVNQSAQEITAWDASKSSQTTQLSSGQPIPLNTPVASSTLDAPNIQRAAQTRVDQPAPEMNRPATSDASESIPTAQLSTSQPTPLNTQTTASADMPISVPPVAQAVLEFTRAATPDVSQPIESKPQPSEGQPEPLNTSSAPYAPDTPYLQRAPATPDSQPASELTRAVTPDISQTTQPTASQPTALNTPSVSPTPDVLNIPHAEQNRLDQPVSDITTPDASESIQTTRQPLASQLILPNTQTIPSAPDTSSLQRAATPHIDQPVPQTGRAATLDASESIQMTRQSASSQSALLNTQPTPAAPDAPHIDQPAPQASSTAAPDISRTTQPSASEPVPLSTRTTPSATDTPSLQRAANPPVDQSMSPEITRATTPNTPLVVQRDIDTASPTNSSFSPELVRSMSNPSVVQRKPTSEPAQSTSTPFHNEQPPNPAASQASPQSDDPRVISAQPTANTPRIERSTPTAASQAKPATPSVQPPIQNDSRSEQIQRQPNADSQQFSNSVVRDTDILPGANAPLITPAPSSASQRKPDLNRAPEGEPNTPAQSDIEPAGSLPTHQMDVYEALMSAGMIKPSTASEPPISRRSRVQRTSELAATPQAPSSSSDIEQTVYAADSPEADLLRMLDLSPNTPVIRRKPTAPPSSEITQTPNAPEPQRTQSAPEYFQQSPTQSTPSSETTQNQPSNAPVSISGFIQRMPIQRAGVDVEESSPTNENNDTDAGEGVNVEELARQVYQMLRERLRIERERRGR